MGNPSNQQQTRWHVLFDEAVVLVGQRRLSDALAQLQRVRRWQRHQSQYGSENHAWHEAEVLWLSGVALERARQRKRAEVVWRRLARVYRRLEERGASSFLPECFACSRRELGFIPNWLSTARILKDQPGRDEQSTAILLADLARMALASASVESGA